MEAVVDFCSLSNFPCVSLLGSRRFISVQLELKFSEVTFRVVVAVGVIDVNFTFDDLASLEVELVVV